jgi:hypothetical protein
VELHFAAQQQKRQILLTQLFRARLWTALLIRVCAGGDEKITLNLSNISPTANRAITDKNDMEYTADNEVVSPLSITNNEMDINKNDIIIQ